MKYAQIRNSKVFGIFEYDLLPKFAPNIVMVECDDTVKPGYAYVNSAFAVPKAVAGPIKTTRFYDFVYMIGEDSYATLSASTSKKAVWIMKVWSDSGVVDPNDSKHMEALVLMKNNALISDADFITVTE